MPYIFHGEIENNEAMVTRIIHIDEVATEEDRQTGIHFESIPEAEPQIGKVALLYINTETNQLFYKYVDRPLTPEEEIQQLKERLALMQQALDALLLGGMQ